MRLVVRLSSLIVLLLCPATLEAQAGPSSSGPRSVLEGVFAAPQAKRGESVYRDVCGACHSTSQFTGESFRMAWVGRTVRDLYRLVRNTMPNDGPGRLSDQEYIDVISYLLEINDYPAGKAELAADEDVLRRIRIEKPEG